LITLILPSVSYTAVPPYIEGDTIENICKKVTCHPELNKAYKKYFTKKFHKAFAISSYKSGNKYYINFASWTYQYPNRSEAEKMALKNCNKPGRNCEILFRNSSITNDDLYERLTQITSTNSSSSNSSSGIPPNAHALSGSGWECNSGYARNGNICVKYNSVSSSNSSSASKKIPANAYKSGNSWKCNSGYYRHKTVDYCYRLPSNAYALSSKGWACNSSYTKSDNNCIKYKANNTTNSSSAKKVIVPANAYATGFGNQGWKCNSGFTQSGNKCLRKNTYSSKSKSDDANDKYVADTLEGKTGLGKILSWAGLLKDNKSKSKSSTQKKVYIPANATASGASGWLCNYGYKRSGNSCIKNIYIPANAYAYGTSWKCFDGFKKVGTRCEKLTWKDGEYWDQEVRPGVNRMMALGILLSEMGSNNRRNTNFNKTLINSSPKLNSTPTFGYRYGEWLYDSNNNFMGYIKNGVTYDKSMRQTGTIRNNNIYNNTGNYVSPLGQDYEPGNVDFFD
ncbi:MAG: hypothetical protein HOI39_00085, partial [Flavobacteriales bacterium]|nr:hypothetical protein [Flavobacteriales bacterium]